MAVPVAQGEVGGVRALSAREAVARLRLGTPESAEAQLLVSEGMISNESRVREIRTLGSMSGERKRCQRADRGTGTVAKAVGNRESLHPPQARLSSTLQIGRSQARPRRAPRPLPLRAPGAVPKRPSPVPVRARGDGRQGQQRKSYRPTDIRIPCEVPKALPEAGRDLCTKCLWEPSAPSALQFIHGNHP